jgi:hypothetical protein
MERRRLPVTPSARDTHGLVERVGCLWSQALPGHTYRRRHRRRKYKLFILFDARFRYFIHTQKNDNVFKSSLNFFLKNKNKSLDFWHKFMLVVRAPNYLSTRGWVMVV